MREKRWSVKGEQAFDIVRLCRYFSELSPQPMVAVEGTTHIVRHLNAAVKIISSVDEEENVDLIKQGGADVVVSMPKIGGYLLADAVVRSHTAAYACDLLSVGGTVTLTERPARADEEGLRMREVKDALVLRLHRGSETIEAIARPDVTIQLPLYNEMYVADRLIDACVEMDYPRHLLEMVEADHRRREVEHRLRQPQRVRVRHGDPLPARCGLVRQVAHARRQRERHHGA